MAAIKFLNLFALSSLALLACSFGATPVAALSVEGIHARDVSAHGHDAIARRKRTETTTVDGKRCKVRSTSAPAATPSSSKKTTQATTTPAASKAASTKAASTKAATSSSKKATSSSKSSSAVASKSTGSATSSSKKVGLAWANGDSPNLSNFVTSHTNLYVSYAFVDIKLANFIQKHLYMEPGVPPQLQIAWPHSHAHVVG